MTATTWELTIKPSFLSELLTLPGRMARQVQQKIDRLRDDPRPDGHHKKKIKGHDRPVFRLRIGDYRLFYTFGEGWIRLLALRLHHEGYDDEDIAYEEPEVAPPPAEPDASPPASPLCQAPPGHWGEDTEPEPVRTLPRPLTPDLLKQLKVPTKYHAALASCRVEDELLEVPVPVTLIERILDALFPRPLDEVLHQPDYVLADTEDLIKFKEGDLKTFLLRLDPDQEKLVDWALKGPSLIKGGPGTGKSTVALYRVRALLEYARRQGRADVRVLFTTYTNALTRVSRQLLEQLLGRDVDRVEVQTADKLARRIVQQGGRPPRIANDSQLRAILDEVRAGFSPPGANAFDVKVRKAALDKLRGEFLLDEFHWVIEGRGLKTLDEYLAADRSGRGVPLREKGREGVWALYQAYQDRLTCERLMTWGQVRAKALDVVRRGTYAERYDAVLIDEAQDLTPTALALLVELCRSPEGVYLTADASQSLYARGFRWEHVHEQLQFKGRTAILRRNYRTTREIASAASAFLAAADGAGDPECVVQECVFDGDQPILRAYRDDEQALKMAANFIRQMGRHLRLKPQSAAVLVPSSNAGERVAKELSRLGLPAQFMMGKDLDLDADAVKVLTLHSAKGLEFPIVVLHGLEEGVLPRLADDMDEGDRAEEARGARRLVFVGMTRAMRGLLVMYPLERPSPFVSDLTSGDWNLG
ncbi:MAG: UvrD-helicase domain-containing protein [Planctomycetaceae bacterium]|nr:UvrD-helicase domain-containing protein [Planctomycetaceae bacterium]